MCVDRSYQAVAAARQTVASAASAAGVLWSTLIRTTRAGLFGLALGLGTSTVGCRPKAPVAPARAHQLQPSSAVMSDADLVVRALATDDLQLLRQWMTPELRGRVDVNVLDQAGTHLRKQFGMPRGLLEERTHREGELHWYSGLWVHEKNAPGKNKVLTPVLYQFALDEKHRLARLLVREHWFLENLVHPADYYQPITRFHFVGAGEWTVSNGGRARAINHHFDTTLQRFAYDLVIKKNGRKRRPGQSGNQAHYCYGAKLLAPAAGTVILAINDVPDNRPGEKGKKGGNGVVIDHGFGEYSALWHAIPGSVQVKEGDRVEVGQLVALAGNSGHSSGPHVHFHVQTRGRKGGDLGLPAPFVEVWVDSVWREAIEPRRGETVRIQRPGAEGIAGAPRVFVNL
jgi:murein DD-endopeptidase MepM/ murein hydrolase activator NlpD